MKRTLIAAAVLVAASGSALAAPQKVYLFNATMVGEAVGVEGLVGLYGCVHVSSTAGAVINNSQMVNVNASLDPQAQSYTTGRVTTSVNNNTSTAVGGGSAWATVSQSQSSKSSGSQGFEASGGYAYGNQSSAVKGGGYTFSQQAAGIEGGFSHTSQNSGGHVAAGGSIGGSYGYQSINTPHFGEGSAHASGGFSAGYNESSYANSSGVAGGFEATEASGKGKVWGYSADQGSGYAAVGEQSSGYTKSSSSSKESYGVAFGIDAGLTTTDVTTKGSVTQHTNTQTAGTLTATTGSSAANGVSGNLGINITEGIDNAQSNDVSLASVDIGNVFGNAQIFNSQASAGTARINNFNLNASIGDNSLQSVSGNVGVNVSSGIGNVQNNSLAGAVTTTTPMNAETTAMVATDDNSQTANMSVKGQFQGTAMLGSGALMNASGNIGVNIAGGAGNLQHNGLAIAALNSGK
ncbi:hypothetical protein LFL96_14480 [Paraburkholderia sp. D15]|uniref:hypothetical protein n=1 Tax=Paraburkholderia sp. D15 TaxID=2880218 RepID=UPI00247A09A5|nr:hypothetical protein [Paraburkholderia sp. D15]WGS48969.1 hypothetical protein LFL96_14480 [Paraburkholderia sp. D15]WKF56858.1 hypothetical protein HUO10_001329 [Paraburkholderia busanensis]